MKSVILSEAKDINHRLLTPTSPQLIPSRAREARNLSLLKTKN
jgi:hypothetical protein